MHTKKLVCVKVCTAVAYRSQQGVFNCVLLVQSNPVKQTWTTRILLAFLN